MIPPADDIDEALVFATVIDDDAPVRNIPPVLPCNVIEVAVLELIIILPAIVPLSVIVLVVPVNVSDPELLIPFVVIP